MQLENIQKTLKKIRESQLDYCEVRTRLHIQITVDLRNENHKDMEIIKTINPQ